MSNPQRPLKPAHLLVAAALAAVIGFAAGASMGRALALSHAFPRGVMAINQQHFEALRRLAGLSDGGRVVAPGDCAHDAAAHLRILQAVAPDIEPALLEPGAVEPELQQWARQLRERLARANAAPPADCAALAVTVRELGETCQGCHRRYR
jgi:hypothetical protein